MPRPPMPPNATLIFDVTLVKTGPTPAGVPVAMMSPGSSVMKLVMNAIVRRGAVGTHCRKPTTTRHWQRARSPPRWSHASVAKLAGAVTARRMFRSR